VQSLSLFTSSAARHPHVVRKSGSENTGDKWTGVASCVPRSE
jgi:hypothetical protein